MTMSDAEKPLRPISREIVDLDYDASRCLLTVTTSDGETVTFTGADAERKWAEFLRDADFIR